MKQVTLKVFVASSLILTTVMPTFLLNKALAYNSEQHKINIVENSTKKEAPVLENMPKNSKNINLTGDKVLEAQQNGALLIDVRDEIEYKSGHIKGAINLPLSNIENEISNYVKDKNKKIVLYCNTGNKSKKALDKLITLGYKNVWNGQGVKEYNYNLIKDELSKLQVKLVDKNGNKISKTIKATVYDNWGSEDEGYDIISKDGTLDFNDVLNKPGFDDQSIYTIKIKTPKNTKILNLSDNSDNPDNIVFKQNKDKEYTVNKFLANSSSAPIDKLVLDIPSNIEEKYEKGEEVTISDIDVVDENNKPLADNTLFETFNKENKDMAEYKVKNGKLSGIKAKVGDRMKLGLQDESKKDYTLMDKNKKTTYFNYVWFKVNEKGQAIRFNDITNEDISQLTSIQAINKNTLIGTKPDSEKIKYDINVFDITANKPVIDDEVKFSITGDGETKEVISKNGIISLDLYKNTKYTINLVRTMKNSYKMNGFSFILDKDGVLKTEDNQKLSSLNVYQGSYLVRVYVLYKGKFAKQGLEFDITEDNTKNTQTRKVEGKFLNFDTEINTSYTISIKDNSEGYKMEPVHITMKKYDGDGLYWAMLDSDKTPKGDDGKIKALFLKKDGENLDTSVPNGGCGNSNCNISKELITPKSLTVETYDNSNIDGMVFKLFNSTTQNYEKDVKVENGKINLNLYSGNKYFLQLVNNKYYAHNTYIVATNNNDTLINPKTNNEVTKIKVNKKSKEQEGTNRYNQTLQVINNGKPVDDVTLEFISENDTFKATAKNGVINFSLLEDVTYVVKSLDDRYETLIFPLVLKDKMEWGNLDDKRLFDHTSCNSVQSIILYDKGKADNNGKITSPLGTITINGMHFNNLELNVETLNKENFTTLKDKDVEIVDLMLINPFRCEKTKIQSGEFKIQKTLMTNKEVKKVYYIDENEKQIPLKFNQKGQFLDIINVTELGNKKLVIEYKNNELDFKENIINKIGYLDNLTKEQKDSFIKEVNSKVTKGDIEKIYQKAKELDKKQRKNATPTPDVTPNPYPSPDVTPAPEVKADWKNDEVGYKYQRANGSFAKDEWEPVNGTWYHFDENGYMQTGWLNLDGTWYYLNVDGSMAKDTWIGTYYVDASGAWVIEGWQNNGYGWWYQRANGTYPNSEWEIINGIWYYFDANGYMLADTTTPDGYYVDVNGAWIA